MHCAERICLAAANRLDTSNAFANLEVRVDAEQPPAIADEEHATLVTPVARMQPAAQPERVTYRWNQQSDCIVVWVLPLVDRWWCEVELKELAHAEDRKSTSLNSSH